MSWMLGRTILGLCWLVALACFVLTDARAQEGVVELPPGRVLFDSDRMDLKLMGAAASDARLEAVSVAGQPFKRAYRATVTRRPKETYQIQAHHRLEAPLPKGHTMMYTGYLRAVRTEDETAEAKVGAVVEQAGEPFYKEVHQEVTARGQWQPFYLPFRVRDNHTETGSQLTLRVGYAPQTVEFGGVRLIDLGPDASPESLPRTRMTYKGHEPDAPWRKAAAERIERHRKGDLSIEVVDASGQPVQGAQVSVRMRRHAFEFGCVYNVSRIVGGAASQPDSRIYREKFVELFNVAVDEWAMKWPAWEDPQARQSAIQSVAWMREHGIPVRGHTMVWPSWRRTPKNLPELANDPAALRQRVADHIASVGGAFAGQVIDWDVVNEPYTHYDILEILGRDVMAEWFKLARQADPNAVLYLNEAGQPNSPPNSERYDVLERDVRMLLDAGAPIGGIGMQGHFGQHLNSPEELLAIYDRFAKLGLPIKITELDVDHPDETLQAEYLRDFMIVSFSHPSINGILMWGFWESQHWRPNAALWRKDWSIKPAGEAWLDLVRNQWWTKHDGQTDTQGALSVRGFLGEYEVSATLNNRTTEARVSLPREGAAVRLVLE